MICFVSLLHLPPMKGGFPVGYADFTGELSLIEAQQLSGLKPTMFKPDSFPLASYLQKQVENPFAWKQVLDYCVASNKMDRFCEAAQIVSRRDTGSSLQAKRQNI